MGTASASVMGGRREQALAAYKAILDWDTEHVELPDWYVWPRADNEQGRGFLEEMQQKLEKHARGLRARAVDKVYYIAKSLDAASAIAQLQQIAARYDGTSAGERARQLLREYEPASADDPLALPPELLDHVAPADVQSGPGTTEANGQTPAPTTTASQPEAGPGTAPPDAGPSRMLFLVGAIVALAVLFLAIVFFRARRPRRTSHDTETPEWRK